MSTPTPAPAAKDPSASESTATEPAPFDPHDFPSDLRDAQRKAAEYGDRLYEALRSAAAAVQGHSWLERCAWHGIKGADIVAARQALKSAKGAVPLAREDVDTAA
ncbi:hypothetical protein [Streptomyces sp. NPDC001137]|uniref:hypothetical protein n=1 Tax=Streptomyces sp. NPDC001137 TaxID=3154378 RepID=UPI003322F485